MSTRQILYDGTSGGQRPRFKGRLVWDGLGLLVFFSLWIRSAVKKRDGKGGEGVEFLA